MEVSDKNSWGEFLKRLRHIINLKKQEIKGVYGLILLPEINFSDHLGKKKETSLIKWSA